MPLTFYKKKMWQKLTFQEMVFNHFYVNITFSIDKGIIFGETFLLRVSVSFLLSILLKKLVVLF